MYEPLPAAFPGRSTGVIDVTTLSVIRHCPAREQVCGEDTQGGMVVCTKNYFAWQMHRASCRKQQFGA